MKPSLIVLLATLVVFLQLVRSDQNEGFFNIVEGNCTTALAKEMIFREHISKYAIVLVERNATSVWYGDEKIYCVRALNAKNESEGSIAFIKKGGVGHHFVTVEMHSKSGYGLEYDIELYAK